MKIERHDITGVVLAGGQGQRMGGVDKGWVLFQQEPLVSHVLRRLEPQVGALIINANRELTRYRALGHRVVSDESAEDGATPYTGPLAGVLAAMRSCTTPWMVTVPCDCPQLPGDLVAQLATAILQANTTASLATAITRLGKDHQIHAVFSLVHCRLQSSVAAYLEAGGRSVHRWLTQEHALQVPFENASELVNLNTMRELEDLQRQITKTQR